jgi:hypothetical protein
MRGVGQLRRGWVALSALMLAGLLLSGCKTVQGGPDRLYTIPEEVAAARVTVETLATQYYAVGPNAAIRNEIISRRMYIIDVEYSQYEEALTRERQEVGFITSTVAQGLNVAGALSTPAQTVRILSGLAGGVGAVRGYYDSEIVVAKTIQIAQGQMRFLRDKVSDKIRGAMSQPIDKYPLSLAMSDLEEYYRAGTLAAGLIKAVGDSGTAADISALQKQNIIEVNFGSNTTTLALQACLKKPGARAELLRLLPSHSRGLLGQLTIDVSPAFEIQRVDLLTRARLESIC